MKICSYIHFAFVSALLAVSVCASGIPKPVCFKKSQECCFKFAVCGKVKKSDTENIPCPFKKCFPVCAPKCKIVTKKIPTKKCTNKKVIVGQTCKKIKIKKGHLWIWKKVCTPKFGFKKICKTIIITKKIKKCKKVCNKVCKLVQAVCPKTTVRVFLKYCAKLSCGPLVGSGIKPADFVAKTGKIVDVIKGKPIVKH